jgi:fumarate reductase subunit C
LPRLSHPHELHRILPARDRADLFDRRIEARDDASRLREARVTAALFVLQRASAMMLAFAVTVHLVTILYAVRGGLTAGEVLARTRGNGWFLAFYLLFAVAVAVHAPIGLRNILREWTLWRGRSLDVALALFAAALLFLGLRAALAVYLPLETLR